MELLKAFKSPFSSRVEKKNLLSTYSKILFRFNFLRLPYIAEEKGLDAAHLGLRRGVFRGLEDLLVLKNRAFYMLLIACLTSSIRPSPRALWPLEVGSCAPLATFPLLLTTNLEFKI